MKIGILFIFTSLVYLVIPDVVQSKEDVLDKTRDKPNIVFVLVDDVGFNDVGFTNVDDRLADWNVKTPTLDRLSRQGLVLDNYYVQPICTPTRASLMTGRYPFRFGVTGFTIGANVPWGIPLNETFLPEFLQDQKYKTGFFGKHHLGFFRRELLPSQRGFQFSSGLLNAKGDHFFHTLDGGYDWYIVISHIYDTKIISLSLSRRRTQQQQQQQQYHRHTNDITNTTVNTTFSGEIVRDDVVRFLENTPTNEPFYAQVSFQEAHSPFQAPETYLNMYENIQDLNKRAVAAMVTHTDQMISDIVETLNRTGHISNTILFFSSDNGAPGVNSHPQRWDSTVIDRNYPFRGQKHELFEGGVRAAGFIYSPLMPSHVIGTKSSALLHITDWFRTIISAVGGDLSSRTHLPLDSHDMWDCLFHANRTACSREEIVLNINTVCDLDSVDYETECPAPKAAIRVGDLKLLVECFNSTKGPIGRRALYNITSDPTESHDLSEEMPEIVERLAGRLMELGSEALLIPPLSDTKPWQGSSYYCAKCDAGKPQGNSPATWIPWYDGY